MSKKKEKAPLKTCSKCDKEHHPERGYYTAPSDMIFADGRLTICKTCLRDLVDFNEPNTLINVLRSIDRPFLRDLYESSLTKDNPWGNYMKVIAAQQNADKTYADSIFTPDLEKMHQLDTTLASARTTKNEAELRRTWGMYSTEEYEFLEDFYAEYEKVHPTDNRTQINAYRSIAKTHLQADIELGKGAVKNYKDLMELSLKLHKDAGISAQGGDEDKGMHAYGVWIEDIEKTEPCEYFKNKKTYEDYDGFKKYWENWIIRPFRNIFGLSNDVEDKDRDGDRNDG